MRQAGHRRVEGHATVQDGIAGIGVAVGIGGGGTYLPRRHIFVLLFLCAVVPSFDVRDTS